MTVCKYFGMCGQCERCSGRVAGGGFASFIDMGCRYATEDGFPTEGQESCEGYKPFKKKRKV